LIIAGLKLGQFAIQIILERRYSCGCAVPFIRWLCVRGLPGKDNNFASPIDLNSLNLQSSPNGTLAGLGYVILSEELSAVRHYPAASIPARMRGKNPLS
jgi:hypothetical protein